MKGGVAVAIAVIVAGCVGPPDAGITPAKGPFIQPNPVVPDTHRASQPFPEDWADCIKIGQAPTCYVDEESRRAAGVHVPGLDLLVKNIDRTVRPLADDGLLMVRAVMPQRGYNYDAEGGREPRAGYPDWIIVDPATGLMRPLGHDWYSFRNSVAMDGQRIAYGEVPLYLEDEAPRPFGRGGVFLYDAETGIEEQIAVLDNMKTEVVDLSENRLLLKSHSLGSGYHLLDLESNEMRRVMPQGFDEHDSAADVDGYIVEAGLTHAGVAIWHSQDHFGPTVRHIGFEGRATFEVDLSDTIHCRQSAFDISDRYIVISVGHTFQSNGCPAASGFALVHDVLIDETWRIADIHFGSVNGETPAAPVARGEQILYGGTKAGHGREIEAFWVASNQHETTRVFTRSPYDDVWALALDHQNAYFIIDGNLYVSGWEK